MKTLNAFCDKCGDGKRYSTSASFQKHIDTHSKPQHTPTPWKHDKRGGDIRNKEGMLIASGFRYENAAFIARAVNAHEEMLNALKLALKTMYANPDANMDMITGCSTTIKQAIAKAEGK